MKIVAISVLGHPTYFVKLIPSTSDESTSPIVRMCSNPERAADLTQAEADAVLPEIRKCYPTAVIEVEPANDAAQARQSPECAGSRLVCTAASPMPKNAPGRWQHPDAKSDPRNDPYYDHYNCPNCGLHFAVEVAE
jgi:hypothetical protein